MQDILSALPTLLVEHGDNEEVRRSVVFAVWRRVAGDSLNEHALPVELDGNTLKVAVADRNWQRNLSELSGEMLFRMNFTFGSAEVKRIEFVIDKAAVAGQLNRSVDRVAAEAKALDEINEPLRKAADVIEDDDMRRKFLLAAGSCLARQRRLATR
jgi:Dna[CI] antecedent DciA-like protein